MKFSKIHNGIKVAVLLGGIGIAVPAVWAQGIGLRALERSMVSTEFQIERGKKVYERNCVRCHGADGSGQTEFSQKLEQPPPNLAAGEYRRSGGKVSTFNVVAKGTNGHPVFGQLAYQDQWAVTHYVRSLGPTDEYTDPPEVVEQARFEAENGTCDEAVKANIDQKMAFQGEEQIETGKKVFAANCSSCHGAEGGGDGPAAAALEPKPRDFTSADQAWTNGTSPLALFDTLANGVPGTSMAAFAHLPESERWALVHLIREEWVPASKKEEATEEQVAAVCRTLSAGGAGESIPISSAMRFLSEDIAEQRAVRFARYGTTWVADSASSSKGKALFETHCQACHGAGGTGNQLGPYGVVPPYLFVDVGALEPASAGGTFREFAERSLRGSHISLPDMTGVAQLSARDWQSLQAYVATFEGEGTVKAASLRPVDETEEATGEENPDEATPTDGAPASNEGSADQKPAADKPKPAAKETAKEQPKADKPKPAADKPKPAADKPEPADDEPSEEKSSGEE